MTLLTIYLIGVLVSFIACKLLRGKENNTPDDVDTTLKLSALSWAGFLILVIIGIITYYSMRKK